MKKKKKGYIALINWQKNAAKSRAKRKKSHKRRLESFRRTGILVRSKSSLLPPLVIKNYARVKMPSNFSFVNNPNEVLERINTLNGYLKTRKPVFVNVKHVIDLTTDAIVLLASVLDEFKLKGVKFNGNFPADLALRDKFEASGFFHYLYNIPHAQETESHLYGANDKYVKSDLAAEVIKKSTKTVVGTEKDNVGVFRTLVEVMTNTHNWADANAEGTHKWWLLVEHDPTNAVVRFSFVDNGIGILESLNKRAYKQGLMQTLHSYLKKRTDVLIDVLEGKVKSRTGLSFRGKGLPAIYSAFKGNYFSNFTLITNNVCLNLQSNRHAELSHDFSGTFFYFEMNKKNIIT